MDKLFWRKIVSAAVQRAIAAGSTYIYMSIYTTSGIPYIHLFVFPRNILELHGSLSPLASKWNQTLHRRHGQTAEAGAWAGAGREQEQAWRGFRLMWPQIWSPVTALEIHTIQKADVGPGPIHLCHLYARVTSQRSGIRSSDRVPAD